MKALLAVLLTVGAVPTFAGDREPAKCYSGQFREPFCPFKIVRKHGTVVVEKLEPDAIMLPYWPYVVVK
jgi:hypothetical protein